ncbi:MAG: PIN domain-containing protein [Acidobacteria bacterium]|nr:PIN domain-containing protein [Acidobacteriota bacterium]
MKALLLDTGVIVALLDRSERTHAECARLVQGASVQLVTCEAVIAESCYLTRGLPGAGEAILENVATGVFRIPLHLSESARSIQRTLKKYADRKVDFADACLIHLATEIGTGEILTLDSDFLVYRWGTNQRFRPLLPLGTRG